jgi:hypothetical protein
MSPTMTLERLRGQLSLCCLAVRMTVANVPGVDTVMPGVVIAPNTPVIFPAWLSILPELKKLVASPWFRRPPSCTVLTATREASKVKSNCIPAMGVPGVTSMLMLNCSPASRGPLGAEILTAVVSAADAVLGRHSRHRATARKTANHLESAIELLPLIILSLSGPILANQRGIEHIDRAIFIYVLSNPASCAGLTPMLPDRDHV